MSGEKLRRCERSEVCAGSDFRQLKHVPTRLGSAATRWPLGSRRHSWRSAAPPQTARASSAREMRLPPGGRTSIAPRTWPNTAAPVHVSTLTCRAFVRECVRAALEAPRFRRRCRRISPKVRRLGCRPAPRARRNQRQASGRWQPAGTFAIACAVPVPMLSGAPSYWYTPAQVRLQLGAARRAQRWPGSTPERRRTPPAVASCRCQIPTPAFALLHHTSFAMRPRGGPGGEVCAPPRVRHAVSNPSEQQNTDSGTMQAPRVMFARSEPG